MPNPASLVGVHQARPRLGPAARWAPSGVASITPSSSRSGVGCRSNSWTGRTGGPRSSWPTRSSTTANARTRDWACLVRDSTPATEWPELQDLGATQLQGTSESPPSQGGSKEPRAAWQGFSPLSRPRCNHLHWRLKVTIRGSFPTITLLSQATIESTHRLCAFSLGSG